MGAADFMAVLRTHLDFLFLVRDIPELARNTLLFGAGASLLAALGAGYEMRRRNHQTVLYLQSAWPPGRPVPWKPVPVQSSESLVSVSLP